MCSSTTFVCRGALPLCLMECRVLCPVLRAIVCVALSIALYRFCHRVFFGVIIGSATMRQCVSLFVAFLSRLSLRAVNCSVGVVIIFA